MMNLDDDDNNKKNWIEIDYICLSLLMTQDDQRAEMSWLLRVWSVFRMQLNLHGLINSPQLSPH